MLEDAITGELQATLRIVLLAILFHCFYCTVCLYYTDSLHKYTKVYLYYFYKARHFVKTFLYKRVNEMEYIHASYAEVI